MTSKRLCSGIVQSIRFPYNFWYVYHESADIVIVLRVSHKRQDDEQIKWRLPDE